MDEGILTHVKSYPAEKGGKNQARPLASSGYRTTLHYENPSIYRQKKEDLASTALYAPNRTAYKMQLGLATH